MKRRKFKGKLVICRVKFLFIEGMNGLEFLKLMQGMRGLKDTKRRDELIERLQFDVKTPIRKMSKGMKQKVGIVRCFYA